MLATSAVVQSIASTSVPALALARYTYAIWRHEQPAELLISINKLRAPKQAEVARLGEPPGIPQASFAVFLHNSKITSNDSIVK